MKFIKWVIEVRPFRLLVDCMAAYSTQNISYDLCGFCVRNLIFCSRIQQQHPHPQAGAAFGLCAVSSETDYSSQQMMWIETSTLCRSFQNHRRGAAYDPRSHWKTRFALVKAKASGMDCTRSLRPERPTSLLTSRSIKTLGC